MAKERNSVTVGDLVSALKSKDVVRQWQPFHLYCKQQPSIDALPVLRKALRHKDFSVVRCAAESLHKLGKEALPALIDLRRAAYRINTLTDIPQAYPECLQALVAIDPDDEEFLLDMISHFTGITNWEIVSAGMSALQKLGTPKALSLLHRIHTFWYGELNKIQQKQADKFLKPLK